MVTIELDKKLIATGTALILIATLVGWLVFAGGAAWIGHQLSITGEEPPTVPGYTYTQGLTVNFKLNDAAAAAVVVENVTPGFYNYAADPFAITSVDTSIGSGSYSSTVGAWQALLDAGSYQLLVKDSNTGSEVFYPALTSVTVPGTNVTTDAGLQVVTLNPAVIQLTERATPSVTATVKAFNTTSNLYDIALTTIDIENQTKFQISYTIAVGGTTGQALLAGRMYVPVTSGMSIVGATLNNVAVGVISDTDGTSDGLTGYYIEFPNLPAGTTSTLNLQLQKTSTVSATTYDMTLYEDYACHNTALRWWSDTVTSLTIDDGS